MNAFALLSVFGLAGVWLRYGVDQWLGPWNDSFPVSTLLINVVGSAVAGALFVFAEKREIDETLRIALFVGFCGGFTTFSAYAIQTIALIEKGRWVPAATYLTVSPALAIFAAALSMQIIRRYF